MYKVNIFDKNNNDMNIGFIVHATISLKKNEKQIGFSNFKIFYIKIKPKCVNVLKDFESLIQ